MTKTRSGISKWRYIDPTLLVKRISDVKTDNPHQAGQVIGLNGQDQKWREKVFRVPMGNRWAEISAERAAESERLDTVARKIDEARISGTGLWDTK